MDDLQIHDAFTSKREYFDMGYTHSYEFRIARLKELKSAIKNHESEILSALYADLHKPKMEAFTSEIGIMYAEIDHTIKHLCRWMKPRRISTPMVLQPSSSRIYSEPLGVVLIIGPWNYPFQLLLAPLVGAIAAGNCSIIKPSDNTRSTAAVVQKLIETTFSSNYISVVQGPGAMVGPMLIEKFRFDHIFFTGSPGVGKQIMAMASAHLTPVTLELGGKSPAIVHNDANLDVSAKRLVWAKFFNAGQTCVAPDYLLVHTDVKDRFIELMVKYIKEFYGDNPLDSENLTHIVNDRRFTTLMGLLQEGSVVHGGRISKETRAFEPTLIDGISIESKIMQEEIFGPILPILTYNQIEEVVPIIRRNRYPLALYLFTKSKTIEKFILRNVEFGGGAINNALVHLANPDLPFGGVGNSGMGSYHGKRSFDAMSHQKSVLKTATFFDNPLLFPPYSETRFKWIRRFF